MLWEKPLTRFDVLPRRHSRSIAHAAHCAIETLETRVLMSVNVTSYHYNLAETGTNTSETVLTPSNVNTSTFGKVASLPVDGQIYAQPLIMTGVSLPGGSTQDLVVVATEHDSVYAFNAKGSSTIPVWKVSLLQSGETTIPAAATGTNDITPEIGITSTPAINPATNTIYVEGNFEESNGTFQQRLYALNIATGATMNDVVITGSVNGTGVGSSGGKVSFNALLENQRPALTLANGQVYVTFASHGDNGNYHGWVVAYNQTTLAQDYVWCDTPNGSQGGIWMSGGGVAVDSSGDLYLTSGNGTFDANTGGSDYGMALVKLSPSLQVLDYFSPYNEATLSNQDQDYGCGNAVLLPTQSGSAPNEAVTLGKWGGVYLNNTNTGSMGEFTANGPNKDLGETNTNTQQHNTFAYFNGEVYVGPDGGTLRDYAVANGALATTPTSQSSHVFGVNFADGEGAGVSISSNGNSNGIVWALDNSGFNSNPAVLYAYNPANLGQVYWASNQDGTRDTCGNAVKFTTPVVANGFVYVGGTSTLTLYGNIPAAPPPPVSFVKTDSTTGGNWTGTYGADGYQIIGGATGLPGYVTATASNNQFWEWAAPGQASGVAPQVSSGSSSHVAACDFSGSSFSINLNFTDGQSHQVALYLLDYDSQGRVETVQIANGQGGQVLDTRTVSSFQQGKYLVYDLSGDLTVTFTNAGPLNAVLSAILFSAPPTSSAAARFAGVDATTRGNWSGVYGSQGYDVIDGSSNLPSGTINYSISGAQTYQWATSTSDLRDLQTSPGSSNRVAACAYSNNPSFTMNFDFLDGQSHQVSFYLLDYDAKNRAETIQITNATTGAVLDTESFSSFTGGQYARWNLSGDLNITVSNAGGLNEVVSGFFIDPASSPAVTATFLKTDATTMGTWTGTYGKDGYDVINSAQSVPAYATLNIPGSVSNYTWNTNTTQVQALQDSPGSSSRIAACDYSNNPSFTFNLNLTDGKAHQVALYFLDYDAQGRSESVQISNAVTDQVLSTQSVSNFAQGKYLVWNLSGDVNITIANAGGLNEVLSGIFFG